MSDLDLLDTYRKVFNGAQDGLSAWWYFGQSFADIDGWPSIPTLHAETLMLYRTETLSADSFRMHWWEIGVMRDPVTGETAETWRNPVTGKVVRTPSRFEEGPAYYTVTRRDDALQIDLVQAHARVEEVRVAIAEVDGQVLIDQTELKTRGFPLPDGTMPDLDSAAVSSARTRLFACAARQDLDRSCLPASGAYEFELTKLPEWMGFGDRQGRNMVRGTMVKSAIDSRINPTAWARLKQLHPTCFDGDTLLPNW